MIADEPTATPAETTIPVDATTTMAQKTTTLAETAPVQMTTTQGIIQELLTAWVLAISGVSLSQAKRAKKIKHP